VAASATRVRTLCAVGWESPTGISDFWRSLAVNQAPPGVAPGNGRGSSADPLRAPETRPPRAPASRTGFSGAGAGRSKRLAHWVRSGGMNRRSRRSPGCAKQLEPRRIAPQTPSSPSRPVENVRPGWRPLRSVALNEGVRASPRDAPNFQANNPLFKERVPDLHVAFRSLGLSPVGGGDCRASWRFTRFGSRVFACEAVFCSDSTREPGFPLTLHFGSFPAGPHERYRRWTTRRAFHP
jgi:hypothetical protein